MNNNSVKNTLINALGNGLSKVLGFIREMVIAAFYGASALVDAYIVALTVPMMLFTIVNQALNIAVLPLVTEYQNKEGHKSVLAMVNTITTVLVIITAVLIIGAETFTPQIISVVAPGFEAKTAETAVVLTRIMVPIMLFMGLTGIAFGILQSQRRFLYPALSGVAYNLVIVVVIVISARIWGIMGLAIATLMGAISQWFIQVPDLRRINFRYQVKMVFSHPGFKKLGVLVIPVIVGAGASQINILVDRMMASGLVEGSISALGYAAKLYTFITAVLTTAVASAIFPELAGSVVANDFEKFKNIITTSIKALLLLVFPAAVGMIVLRVPIIRLAFERGAFDETATALTVTALFFYALGLPAFALQDVILRAFYSLQDTLTPMYIGICIVGLNVLLIIILVKPLALGGIALATAVSITVGALLLLVFLRLKIGPLGGLALIVTALKIGFASAIMGVAVYLTSTFMQSYVNNGSKGDFIIVLSNIIIGFIVYYAVVRLLKIQELDWIDNWIKLKFQRIFSPTK